MSFSSYIQPRWKWIFFRVEEKFWKCLSKEENLGFLYFSCSIFFFHFVMTINYIQFILQDEVGKCIQLVNSWIAVSWHCLPGRKKYCFFLCKFLAWKVIHGNPGECSLLFTKELKMQWMSFHITYVAQIYHQYIMRKWARTSVPFHFSFEIFNYCTYFSKFLLMYNSSFYTDRVHTFLSQMSFLLRLIF